MATTDPTKRDLMHTSTTSQLRFAAFLAIVAVLTSCARLPAEAPVSKPVPRTRPAPSVGTEAPRPEAPPKVEPPSESEPPAPTRQPPKHTAPPAVNALMEDAEAAAQGGQWDNAAATLERAIRIQPRNPILWSRLANTRLQQHQYQAAEDLAKKSNVFAAGDKELIQQNWRLIAQARREKGDSEGAKDAAEKAGR